MAPVLQHPEVAYKGADDDVAGLDDASQWRQRQRQLRDKWRQQEDREIARLEAAVYAPHHLTTHRP